VPAFQSGAQVAPRPHLCVAKIIFKPGKSSRGWKKIFASANGVVNPGLSARAVS
jgi:hypothetical protein